MTASQSGKPEPQTVTPPSGVLASVKRLGLNSGVYAFGNILTRGLVFLLVPVLTRALTPSEYGILAITTIVCNLLPMALGLGIDSAITQLYFKYNSERERRSLYGTVLAFWLVVPTSVTLILDVLGRAGRLDFFPGIPFRPYLQITIWTSCLSIFIGLPQAIYMSRQEPLKVLFLSLSSALATVGLSAYLVVYLRHGLMGSLWAVFISASLMALIAIVLTWRMASWDFSWSKLKAALVFSLPTVPHVMSQWALSVSDRLILAGFVSAGALGLYSLGYQFGSLVILFSSSIQSAFVPMINAHLTDAGNREKVPPLGTYAVLGITSIGLAVALLGGDLIRLIVPPKFHAAKVVVPWIALGYVFHGIYLIWSRGTWFSMRTTWMPFLTIFAAGLNIGLNLLLVPRWGIMAAAVNTAVAYGMLALLHGYLAHRVYPIQWEYVRWLKILLMALVCFGFGMAFSGDSSMYNFMRKALSLIALFPVSLILIGFLAPTERRFLLSLPDRFRVYL